MATPYLEKNDFGVAHTHRVFDIAKNHFTIKPELQDLLFASIILHDIGGSTVKDQYEKGPSIAASILRKLNCPESFIKQVCKIVGTHHEHPENPSETFKILYDSDKLVMFSSQEFPYYNLIAHINWTSIKDLIYSETGRELAEKFLMQRRNDQEQ